MARRLANACPPPPTRSPGDRAPAGSGVTAPLATSPVGARPIVAITRTQAGRGPTSASAASACWPTASSRSTRLRRRPRRPTGARPHGAEVGRLLDVVVRWQGDPYPAGDRARGPGGSAAGVRAADHRHPRARQALARARRVSTCSTSSDDPARSPGRRHRPPARGRRRRPRHSCRDLYLAPCRRRMPPRRRRRRLPDAAAPPGPARWRRRPTPDRVIDWAAIQPFGNRGADGPPGQCASQAEPGAARLRPGELADLLEDLGRDERQELLAAARARRPRPTRWRRWNPTSSARCCASRRPSKRPRLLARDGARRGGRRPARPRAATSGGAARRHGPDDAAELLRLLGLPRGLGRRCHDHRPRARARTHQTVGQVAAHLRGQAEDDHGRHRRRDRRRRRRSAGGRHRACSSCFRRRPGPTP